MSFLLDALRKSERGKHLGEVPTIHGSEQDAPRRPRRSLAPLLLVLLPAFLVLVWLGSRPFIPGTGDEVQPLREAVPEAAESSPQPDAAGAETSPQTGPPGDPSPELPVSERPIATGMRTPVEEFAPPGEAAEAPAAEPPIAASDAPVDAAVVDDFRADTASALPGRPPDGEEAPEESASYRPAQPDVISYWQLPQSVRDDLPEFRISVLVYAARPEDRFLLINGKRQVEGDSYQSGLVLQEIRREGAVFSYRRYRFLVSR